MVAECIDLFAYTFLAVLTIFVVFWLISIPLKDVSIIDMIWAPAGSFHYHPNAPAMAPAKIFLLCFLKSR